MSTELIIERAPSDRWDRRCVALHRFWSDLRLEGRCPPRGAFDPLDWPDLLPNIWMLDVVRDPFRLRFRLVGSEVVEQIKLNPTGKWLDEAMPHLSGSNEFMERYREVAETGEPSWKIGPPVLRRSNPIRAVENLLLPLAGKSEKVEILLMLSIFHR